MATASDDHDRLAEPAPLRTDTLADSVMILLGLTVVQRLVGFVRSILFCRWLDPEQLGQWDMACGFLWLAAPLILLALPDAFGRYVEHYRQRGQFQTFVRRIALVCGSLTAVAVAVVHLARHSFSRLIFGTPDHSHLVSLLAVCLAAVIVQSFLLALATALRNVRMVSLVQMTNSLTFAGLGIVLLLGWRCSADSVVIAYGGSFALSAAAAFWWMRRTWRALPQVGQPLAHRTLWSKIVPFTGWVLLATVLANLFAVVDRYMIVHFGGLSSDEALAAVGNYHSARIVPLLMVSVAAMLAGVITPHLSHDWEKGHRDRVVARLGLFLKVVVFLLTAGAVAVLFVAPWMFSVAFEGKLDGGRAVLPWTLCYCIWFGTMAIARSYLWCAEKARLAGVALAVGLLVNVGLNLVLLPLMGLLGAVLATTVANLVALTITLVFNHVLGFRTDRGTRVVLAVPLALCLGPWVALLVLAAVALDAVYSDRLLSTDEKRLLAETFEQYRERLGQLRPRVKSAGNA